MYKGNSMKRAPLLIGALLVATSAVAGGHQKPGSHFVNAWDDNGDGQVTLAEATERRSDVFATFDENDDGYLSAEEYSMFDEARANDQKNHKDGKGKGKKNGRHKGMQMEYNDVNKDGRVSLEEFTTQTAGWFAMMDRNADGVVTTADFGK
jgi:Ca2+-binding EF-hand superfamily protein